MDKSTLFLFVLTFVVGIFAGGYLYVMVFAPAFKSDVAHSDQVDPNAMVIDGQMKGACVSSNSCASFKLNEDSSFSYLASPDAKVMKGSLPSDLSKTIFSTIKTQVFFTDVRSLPYDACSAHVHTTEYTYTVTLGGTPYILDTCTTYFAKDPEFQKMLSDVWRDAPLASSSYPTFMQKGIVPTLFEFMKLSY